MTPGALLAEVEGLGYRLTLRSGGLHLKGKAEPPPELLSLILEQRESLIDLLRAEADSWAAHEASLAAGRVTKFPAHLLGYLPPSIRPSEYQCLGEGVATGKIKPPSPSTGSGAPSHRVSYTENSL